MESHESQSTQKYALREQKRKYLVDQDFPTSSRLPVAVNCLKRNSLSKVGKKKKKMENLH